jgi:hypothetical protein
MSTDSAATLPAREIEISDAIDKLDDTFTSVASRTPNSIVEMDYRIAGFPVRLRIAGDDLASDIDRSLCHLRVSDGIEPALTIEVWDEEVAGPAFWTRWPEEVDFYGNVSVTPDARYVLHQRKSAVMLLDRQANRITGCVRKRSLLFLDERARPFHRLLSIWLDDQDVQFIHAALAIAENQGMLFVGSGGSGKSTSSVASFLEGFDFLSDDFVALAQTETGQMVGHSLYANCLIANDHISRFPALAEIAHKPNHDIEHKSVAYLSDHPGGRFARETPISAVILPRVVDQPRTTYRPAKSMEAMLALAPSSIIILPGAAPRSLDKLGDLVTTVPAFWLELGHDVGEIGPTVRRISREVAGNA